MYNEAPSILLRTVHSFLSRTPPSLLADIIIVDDMSTNENMKAPLTAYFQELSPVVRGYCTAWCYKIILIDFNHSINNNLNNTRKC